MNMNPVELNAYGMIFRNGTVTQVRKTLYDISGNEPVVSEELMGSILGMLRNRGLEVVRELAWPIHRLLGNTKSKVLYEVADELGYLDIEQFQFKVYTSGRVQLFVNQRFYNPAVEPLVIDELFQWLNYIEQDIRKRYADEKAMEFSLGPDFDGRLKKTEYFKSPLIPVWRMLCALDQMASSKGRESLLALEYIFRPRTNEYLMMEQQRAFSGDARAIPRPPRLKEEDAVERLVAGLGTPTVYHLLEILDILANIGRSDPPSDPADPGGIP